MDTEFELDCACEDFAHQLTAVACDDGYGVELWITMKSNASLWQRIKTLFSPKPLSETIYLDPDRIISLKGFLNEQIPG